MHCPTNSILNSNEVSSFSTEKYFTNLTDTIQSLDYGEFEAVLSAIIQAWKRGAHFYTLGNGGSALNALHYIADWNKSVKLATGRPFFGTSLVHNMGLLTAYANDVSYEDCFVEQLRGEIKFGDVLIAVSGSGNSENVIRAAQYARDVGALVVGLCGYDGGRLLPICDLSIWVRSNDMQICEDVHLSFGHIVMRALTAKSSSLAPTEESINQ